MQELGADCGTGPIALATGPSDHPQGGGLLPREPMVACGKQVAVGHVFGLDENARLKRAIVRRQRRSRTGGQRKALRRNRDFRYRRLRSWSRRLRLAGLAR